MQSLTIDYVEFTSPDLAGTQDFFASAFGWSFVDYGPEYQDIRGAGTGGGIALGPMQAPLVILKADDLDAALKAVTAAGGRITKPIFAFPGGRRFQFTEPGGTEMGVWSEV